MPSQSALTRDVRPTGPPGDPVPGGRVPPGAPLKARGILTTVVGAGGVVSVLWLALSWALGLGLVVVMTGSMAPALPAGSAVIVQRTPAAVLEVGDVVMVPVADARLPVTHRIITIAPVSSDPQARSLTLKGDANDTPDRATVTVTEVPRVVAAAAGWGSIVMAAQSAPAVAAISIVVAAVIFWAFWGPGRSRARHRAAAHPAHRAGA